MILVGLCGAIGSGKSTFAEFLVADNPKHGHWESWEVIAEIANGLREQPLTSTSLKAINTWLEPLPQLVRKTVHRTMDSELANVTATKIKAQPDLYAKLLEYAELVCIDADLQTGSITLDNKDQFRNLLQWLGGYLAKSMSGDIWYAEIVRRIKAQPDIEIATVGGVRFPADAAVIEKAGGYIVRIERPSMERRDASEVTERESYSIVADWTIINDASLRVLQRQAKQLLRQLTDKH